MTVTTTDYSEISSTFFETSYSDISTYKRMTFTNVITSGKLYRVTFHAAYDNNAFDLANSYIEMSYQTTSAGGDILPPQQIVLETPTTGYAGINAFNLRLGQNFYSDSDGNLQFSVQQELPEFPSVNGVYTLKCAVVDGTVQMNWVADSNE